MAYETDERLKSFLDTNQLHREQLCTAILAIDGRFSAVMPQHPRGGPDGGRDIVATFEGSRATIAAVGFVNQANDSASHRTKVKAKFRTDLERVLNDGRPVDVFVYFTNVGLTQADRELLIRFAKSKGVSHSEIFDRERMRLILDSPDGLSVRFQYLGLALSDAEQATFFSKWGDKINNVIADGFGETHRLLERIQFLHEYALPMKELSFIINLKDGVSFHDVEPALLYGRLLYNFQRGATLGHQFSMVQYKQKAKDNDGREGASFSTRTLELQINEDERDYYLDPEVWNTYKFIAHDLSSGALVVSGTMNPITFRAALSGVERSTITLSDMDGSRLYLYVNRRLALRIASIDVYSDLYKLGTYGGNGFRALNIEEFLGGFDPYEDEKGASKEPLLRIGQFYSPMYFDFSRETPVRMGVPRKVGAEL